MPQLSRRRSLWLVAAVAVLAAGLVVGIGRGGSAPAATPTSSARTVTVSGVGTADGAPDTLTVDFTVHAAYADVQATLDAVSARSHKVLAALRGAGVKQSGLRTSDLELGRNYDSHGTPIGYQSSETVEARITPLAAAGHAMEAAARATDHVSIGNLSFDIAHDASLLTQARANAWADAKSRAQQYAGLAGGQLGQVQTIRETVSNPQPSYAEPLDSSAGAASFRKAVTIRGGRQTLTVRVTVVWLVA